MRDHRSPRPSRPTVFARVLAIVVALAALGAGRGAAQDNPPLHDAAARGDVPEVRRLLDAGAAVDQRGVGDHTALMAASSYGEMAVVKLLLSRGADVTLRDVRGRTALDRARNAGRDDVVTLLEAMALAAGDRSAPAGRRPDPVGPTPDEYACYDVPAGTPMPWEEGFTGIAELPTGRLRRAFSITGPGRYAYEGFGTFEYDARTTMVRWLSGPLVAPGVQSAFARTHKGEAVLYLRTPRVRVACVIPEA